MMNTHYRVRVESTTPEKHLDGLEKVLGVYHGLAIEPGPDGRLNAGYFGRFQSLESTKEHRVYKFIPYAQDMSPMHKSRAAIATTKEALEAVVSFFARNGFKAVVGGTK
ncbi:MAG: hypothetical protein WCK90_04110 [archaeon]